MPTKDSNDQPYSGTIIKKLITVFTGNSSKRVKENSRASTPSLNQSSSFLFSLLTFYPWLLGSLLLFSLFWDFDGISIILFQSELSFQGVLKIISVSGLIGFLTNYIAITMLFRPSQKRPLLGLGLIPAQKKRIAKRLAVAVSDEIINPDLVRQRLVQNGSLKTYREQVEKRLCELSKDEEFRTELKSQLTSYVKSVVETDSVRESLSKQIMDDLNETLQENFIEKTALKAYTMIRGRQLDQIVDDALMNIPFLINKKAHRLDDLLDHIPAKLEHKRGEMDQFLIMVLDQMIHHIDIQKLAEQNLNEYPAEKLEQMIRGATNQQLQTIQYAGAVLGSIGGFVIWQPVYSLLILSLAGGFIYALDLLLMKVKRT